MVTIVFAHPWHGSFNKVILDTLKAKLDTDDRVYRVIDLHEDGFNPVLTIKDLEVYNQGQSIDKLVPVYQEIIKKTDEIVFIFPIWWGTMPAILKGFFDKVLLKDFAFSYENGWTPLLNIPKTLVVTTSESPTEMYKSSIEKGFIEMMLGGVGIKNGIWLNNDQTSHGSDEKRLCFLEKVKAAI